MRRRDVSLGTPLISGQIELSAAASLLALVFFLLPTY